MTQNFCMTILSLSRSSDSLDFIPDVGCRWEGGRQGDGVSGHGQERPAITRHKDC